MSDIKVGDIVKGRDLPKGATWRNVSPLERADDSWLPDNEYLIVSLPATAQERLDEHMDAIARETHWAASVASVVREFAALYRYLRDHPEVLDLLDEVDAP